MDVVYVLGKGSLANDDEIRYSLRSVEQYCEDLGNVYIVGECPDFLCNVTHIAYEDKHKRPWKNTLDKVKYVSSLDSLTDDFLLMNDDFFAFAPFRIDELPYYAAKGAGGGVNGPVSFAVHRPVRLNKNFYATLPINSDMSTSYSPRSFYCNFLRVPPTYVKDLILRPGVGMPSFDDQLADEPWASIDDVTMTDLDFREWIYSIFPHASSFEVKKED